MTATVAQRKKVYMKKTLVNFSSLLRESTSELIIREKQNFVSGILPLLSDSVPVGLELTLSNQSNMRGGLLSSASLVRLDKRGHKKSVIMPLYEDEFTSW